MHIPRFVKTCGAAPETHGPYDDLIFLSRCQNYQTCVPPASVHSSLSDCTADAAVPEGVPGSLESCAMPHFYLAFWTGPGAAGCSLGGLRWLGGLAEPRFW